MFIELADSKLGQGSVGFVFKGYVYAKSQTRFKQKTFAAVKVVMMRRRGVERVDYNLRDLR